MARMKAKKKLWKAKELYPYMKIRKINSNLFTASCFSIYDDGCVEREDRCPLLAAKRLSEYIQLSEVWYLNER